MTASERFQLYLDLGGKGHEELRRRYEEAMRKTRREKSDLLRVIIEDWLNAYEKGEAIRPLAPGTTTGPPGRPGRQEGHR
jgi:hypothetical protein